MKAYCTEHETHQRDCFECRVLDAQADMLRPLSRGELAALRADTRKAAPMPGLAPKVELERVALAIYSHDGGLDDDDHEKFHGARRTPWTALPETERDDYRLMAAAAIEAIRWGSPFTRVEQEKKT